MYCARVEIQAQKLFIYGLCVTRKLVCVDSRFWGADPSSSRRTDHVISLWGPGPAAENSRAKSRPFLRSFARPYLFTQNPYKQRKTSMDDAI
jgi:hypothetical protein